MSLMQSRRPVMLVVLDGWGWRDDLRDNAVLQARTPRFDQLWQSCPHAFLQTSGEDVGLPQGQFGNSEVGHLNIGAGRVVMQDLPRISRAVADRSIEAIPQLQDLIAALRRSGGICHLMGLCSTGGVHAHADHGIALARLLGGAGLPVALHLFTDGRDVPPGTARKDLQRFQQTMPASVRVATVSGRYYAMDRDNRWDRVSRAVDAVVKAQGPRFDSTDAVVDDAAARQITDEFFEPAVIGDYRGMADGDALLCFNYRADRVRQLLAAMLDPAFDGFARGPMPRLCAAVGMTQYSDHLATMMTTLFPPDRLDNTLGAIASAKDRWQLRMAETEKYPHVTYFLNGGREAPFSHEDRIMVPSPKVATYDLQPEMSAPELTERAVQAIRSGVYDLIVLNYANADMVGHTGNITAAIRAVEAVDRGLGRIADAVRAVGGALLVTADHGNAEQMRDPATGGPHTAHTTNKVPVLLQGGGNHLRDGRLADIAPTLLQLMDIKQPAEMTGVSLLARDVAPSS